MGQEIRVLLPKASLVDLHTRFSYSHLSSNSFRVTDTTHPFLLATVLYLSVPVVFIRSGISIPPRSVCLILSRKRLAHPGGFSNFDAANHQAWMHVILCVPL